MIELDLMQYKDLLKVKKEKNKTFIFDSLRKKWLVLQPEELVRQLIIQYLIRERGYNSSRIKVEKGLKINELYKRCDVLVYDLAIEPLMLIECKAPQVKVTQETFRQIAHYNLPLKVPYLLVTNGIRTYCCRMDYKAEDFEYLEEVPLFASK